MYKYKLYKFLINLNYYKKFLLMFVNTLKTQMKYRKIQMNHNSNNNNIIIITATIIVHIIFMFSLIKIL